MIERPFFINLACNGAITSRSMSPHVPLSHDEILADVSNALDLGVQIFHLHTRDSKGNQTSDPEPYGRLIESIRLLPGGRDAILCVTTSGRRESSFELRARVLDLDGDMKPDMASLTLSSLNFVQSASINAPETIRCLAQKMSERGICPELEIFDLGMANFAKVLLKEGLIQTPMYANVLLGNIAGAQVDPIQAGVLLHSLPGGCITAIAGLGRYQLTEFALVWKITFGTMQ
jgi:3-keto-5-aminohexanoate cleavage enzyme